MLRISPYTQACIVVALSTIGLIGCNASLPETETLAPAQELNLTCPQTPLTLTTTLGWETQCDADATVLQTAWAPAKVVLQKLGSPEPDPLVTLLAMLKSQPGLSDVKVSLTDVVACGDLTCLSYEATFQRLSRQIQRLGVIAVSPNESWEFATSFIKQSPARVQDHQAARLALSDLTDRISFHR